MDKEKIRQKMKEFESIIQYEFKNIEWLEKAMCSEKIEKTSDDHANDAIATVGDAILKFFLTDKIYREDETKKKGEITTERSALENNEVLHKLEMEEQWINYAYNKNHFYDDKNIENHKKVVCKEDHCSYVEGIIAAIFYDSDYDTVSEWLLNKLYPLLKKYSQK